MAMTFAQTDTQDATTGFNNSCGSSGIVANAMGAVECSNGGTLGSSTRTWALSGNQTDTNFDSVFWIKSSGIPSGTSWDAGTWTVRWNITTANMNLTLRRCVICKVDSGITTYTKIGETSGLATSLGSTGVITISVTGSAMTPSAGDQIIIMFFGDNSSMNLASVTVTENQNIDSPFTLNTPSFVWDSAAPMRPHLARKVRDFFLGGLPPKLAKLRMMQNDAGLYVPANDPEFARERPNLLAA